MLQRAPLPRGFLGYPRRATTPGDWSILISKMTYLAQAERMSSLYGWARRVRKMVSEGWLLET